MAFFCTQFVEVAFLHRCQRNGIDRGDSSDQCVLFFIFGSVWNTKYPVYLRQQRKSIFDYCIAGHDLYFMVDQVDISGDMPARFTVPESSIWYVGSLLSCVALLHSFADFDRVGEEYYLT